MKQKPERTQHNGSGCSKNRSDGERCTNYLQLVGVLRVGARKSTPVLFPTSSPLYLSAASFDRLFPNISATVADSNQSLRVSITLKRLRERRFPENGRYGISSLRSQMKTFELELGKEDRYVSITGTNLESAIVGWCCCHVPSHILDRGRSCLVHVRAALCRSPSAAAA